MAYRTALAALALYLGAAGAQQTGCPAFPFNPWKLNVIVFGDVGSAANPRGADFQGAAAAMGSVWYQAFSVDWVGTSSPSNIGHYVGGSMNFNGGSLDKGGLEVAGSLTLNSITVNGPVSVGGDLLPGSGWGVKGKLSVAGTCAGCSGGSVFTPTLNFPRLKSYFECISTWAAGFADTTTYSNTWGTLSITLPAGVTRNYVTIPEMVLAGAYTINVYGTANQELIVNVPGNAVNLANWLTWNVYNGIPLSNVLVNIPSATTLTIGSGGPFNLLAPFAVTTFNAGVITGSFIVKQLLGGNGQINDDFYCTIGFPLTCPREGCTGTAGVPGIHTPSPASIPLSNVSPSPSPRPAVCTTLNTNYATQFPSLATCGCDDVFKQYIVSTYNCVSIAQGCGEYFCTIPIPEVLQAKLALCQAP